MLISMKEGNKDWICNLKTTIIHHVMTCTKTYQKVSQYSDMLKKDCVRYFLFFHQMRGLQKLWEMIFIPYKKFISFLRYLDFCISVLLSFSLYRPLLYDVINCLNKNSITHFVSYHEKEKSMTLKFCPGTYWWKNHAENIHQKLVPDLYLVLANNPKQQLHARNSFKIKVF